MAAPLGVKTRWKRFSLDSPPPEPGVYAIRSGRRWLYIGRSQNIAQRLQNPRHPARITRDITDLPLSYHWQSHQVDDLPRIECGLIRQHEPEWNGGTSFESLWPACYVGLDVDEAEVLAAIGG